MAFRTASKPDSSRKAAKAYKEKGTAAFRMPRAKMGFQFARKMGKRPVTVM
jgi:hypothetical protein